MDKINCVVAIISDKNGRVLLQKKDSEYHFGSNVWSVWGGMIEDKETPKEAILRELKEELGQKIEITNFKFSGNYLYEGNLNGNQIKINHSVFNLKFDGDLSKISLEEGAGFVLFEKDEIKKLNLIEPSKNILKKFF